MEVVASLSQGRTAAAQCGLFTHKSVPVIFEPPYITIFLCIIIYLFIEGLVRVSDDSEADGIGHFEYRYRDLKYC